MDDLKQKTDEELQNIMRASINNQHIPSSIYHKAKQELEFRKATNNSFENIHNSNIAIGSREIQQKVATNTPLKSETSREKWFWWLAGIVGGIIVLLIGAYIFGVGR